MVRALLRIVLLVIVVAAIAAFFFGYRLADRGGAGPAEDAIGTTGARIGESVAEGANRAERFARDAGLTAKITSKMTLDDLVKARTINVDTVDGAVTLRGSVESAAERDRAARLARETEGVTSVTDLLTVRR